MSASASPGNSAPVVCCDLDGVLWRGRQPVVGAAGAVRALREAGVRVAYVTNNSGRSADDVRERLAAMGVDAGAEDVLTSADAAAALLAGDVPRGARVLACAGPGTRDALRGAGLDPVEAAPCEAVVVGWHREFDFEELRRASDAVRTGARFVATNLDPTYPSDDGMLPGNGALVAAVATASGRRPEVAGKPEAPMADLVRERLGSRGIVVGDRPSTDGAFADRLGWPFALVLSGVTALRPGPGGEAIPDPPPAFVADDLGALVPRLLATVGGGRARR